MIDESQQTVKLAASPPQPPENPATPSPGQPAIPATPAPEQPGTPGTPPAPPASDPAGAPQPATQLPTAPPVGPPRFPLPKRRKDDAAAKKPKLSPDEAAREAELKTEESADLIAQRDRLLEKFTVMQADIGGAFYEMAIRDHVRLDVLTRKAAELQRVDAELLAVERSLELERSDAAGLCPGCGAPYGAAVRFCAQCGTPLMPSEAGA
jgi:hypothetical protein